MRPDSRFGLLVMAVVAGIALARSAHAAPTEIPTGRYIAGGIVGTAGGLGIGHAIQGRWTQRGWIFSFGESILTALYVARFVQYMQDDNEYFEARFDRYGNGFENERVEKPEFPARDLALIMLPMIGLRVWEIVDVWSGARPVARPEHAAAQSSGGFALVPSSFGAGRWGLSVGVGL